MPSSTRRSTGSPETDQNLHASIFEAITVVIGYGWDYLFDEHRRASFWPGLLAGLRLYGYPEDAEMLEEAHRILDRHNLPPEDMDDPTIEQLENLALTVEETRRMQEIQRCTRPTFDLLLSGIDFTPERDGIDESSNRPRA